MSEAVACRYLGRRVSIVCHGRPRAIGRLAHVSTRNAFVTAEGVDVPTVRAVPLVLIERIEPVDAEGGARLST
jgi:hypothetical protein